MVDLLSPVGDFNCLKAAVQNGADSVYFGASSFSARAFASNFDKDTLKEAICYAKLRGVKTNLTLNTLIKDSEFDEAFELASFAYESGIDAIIVQDLGLARKLIKAFPDLPIHGSTQMTVHNLNGALELEKLGFKRVVLSRELSLNEIAYICKNTSIEIETFIHGALCISYSGQCLFSSMLGGRSGNRGKCAQTCRLPFKLLENNKKIDEGYLLSTRDLCTLDFIPDLINAGIDCLKIEGRMKNPEYVAIVTKIYRKYIDLALSDSPYVVEESDRKDLLQVFNRGMSSPGHLQKSGNRNLVFKDKPNNMGLFLGKIQKYDAKKGHISVKLNEPISIGDTISLPQETKLYTISELMDVNGKNIDSSSVSQTVILGRIKGKITLGDSVYKMSSKNLINRAKESILKENKKIPLSAHITIKKNSPIKISISSLSNFPIYKNLEVEYTSSVIPEIAINRPIDEDSVIKQINKTNDTPYKFEKITVTLDDGLFLPKISYLNDLRRIVLEKLTTTAIKNISRNLPKDLFNTNNQKEIGLLFNDNSSIQGLDDDLINSNNVVDDSSVNLIDSNNEDLLNVSDNMNETSANISLLLNILNPQYDYSKLSDVKNIYIPLKFFVNKDYSSIINILDKKANLYIYLPTIIQSNYKNLLYSNIEQTLSKFNINGFVISNICNFKLLGDLSNKFDKKLEIICNYTFNVFNEYTISELKDLGAIRYTISPELDRKTIISLLKNEILDTELIVYGRTPLLNMNYCLLGQTDKCYPTCMQKCQTDNKYYLQDRLNMKFRILPDPIQTVTTIYNSKIFSCKINAFDIDFARIDILDENIFEINKIIDTVKSSKRFEGKDFTNGNLNRIV